MKSSILVILLFLTCAVEAQVKMRDVISQMPDTLAPALSKNNRLDCIDFLASNMKAEVNNMLGGKSELQRMTDNYAQFLLSDGLRMQLRLLDTNQEVDGARQLICMVQTYGGDVRESVVRFFSVQWNELPAADFVKLPGEMFTAELNEQSDGLTVTPSTYFDRPATEEQQPVTKLSINLKWCENIYK